MVVRKQDCPAVSLHSRGTLMLELAEEYLDRPICLLAFGAAVADILANGTVEGSFLVADRT